MAVYLAEGGMALQLYCAASSWDVWGVAVPHSEVCEASPGVDMLLLQNV